MEAYGHEQLQLWGGTESTVNRVGDVYFDQLERTGHARRIDDLDRFAEIGLRTLRYPILWERTAPESLARPDWRWPDERMARLRELGVWPIVGLLHHGSGPRYTSLIDPAFPEKLAAYARLVAQRYPWADAYTPVNEPLTTARFSGLYGHWYPHERNDDAFVRILLNECRGTVLAMREIRKVNLSAKLIQTEDLGKTHTTTHLAYRATFENARRWLSYDLLCGRVGREHELYRYLLDSGATVRELAWFRAHPCPPDIVGINSYLTSERYLDENLDEYPVATHGGDGRNAYADVEAVRVEGVEPLGFAGLLREASERYELPLAITEAHLGCTREEQLRWLREAWSAAQQLRAEGHDVRAVTVWSLLGAYDWNNLVTCDNGSYEPGVFDARCDPPRPTALARAIAEIAVYGTLAHPAAAGAGWWQRDDRYHYRERDLRKLGAA